MVRRLFKVRVIHLRGNPASGKTSFLHLIHNHLHQKYPHIGVKCASWPKIVGRKASYEAIPKIMGETPEQNLLDSTRKCLLIDEAQVSYDDDYLWSDLIKEISHKDRGLLIVLAASYGSADNQPATPRKSTPPIKESPS